MSHGKQFTLFSNDHAPNGWKIAIILNELDLTYETRYLNLETFEQKEESHTKYNPNGRIPTLIDHGNGDFVIWESDAIILYLIGKYDPEHKISVTGADEKHIQLQWLFFQSSGQGPYFGQLAWFVFYHSEQVPSIIDRYKKEVRRILGVLNDVLSKQDWLVGGRTTVADLSFVPYNDGMVHFVMEGELILEKEFPAVAVWHAKLSDRPAVKKYREEKQRVQEALEQEALEQV